MEKKIASLYQKATGFHLQAKIIYLMIATILLVSIGGVVSSTVMCLLVIAGLAALLFDPAVRAILLDPDTLRPMVCLLVLVLLWQGLGLFFRNPVDLKAAPVLGSAFTITLLLPTLVASAKGEDSFWRRLLIVLFGLGCIAAAASLARYLVVLGKPHGSWVTGLTRERLIPVGRASHAILGAGGLAATFFAGLGLYGQASRRQKGGIIAGLALIALTIVLTQSRGPILGAGLAMLSTLCVERVSAPRFKLHTAVAWALLCFLIPVGLIVMEPWIRDLMCTGSSTICRPSARQGVWTSVLQLILERPWFGIGPTFRFPNGAVSHPHNGFLGLIFFFGLPMGVLFVSIVALAMKLTLKAGHGAARTFALLGIFFSASFMAADLSNPFAFINTHYLYLWLPIFVGVVAGSVLGTDARFGDPAVAAGRARPSGQP
jgi:O-antigen ligase